MEIYGNLLHLIGRFKPVAYLQIGKKNTMKETCFELLHIMWERFFGNNWMRLEAERVIEVVKQLKNQMLDENVIFSGG